MAVNIGDGRFHGVLPVSIFLKIWGGVGEELQIHPQRVQDFAVTLPESPVHENHVQLRHVHPAREIDENRDILEDIT